MDKEFMRTFLNNYYTDFQSEAIKGSKLYQAKHKQRYEIETELETEIKEVGKNIWQLFEKYLDACADEQEVLLAEMYLMGAQDRERMLRGIIV